MNSLLKIILTSIFSIYTYLTFQFAFNGYPGFIQDSTCFLPTAYFINHFHQLINPLYHAGLDPIQHRFLFYPPLFPYVIAWINSLMPEFYNNMYVTQNLIDVLTMFVLLTSVVVYIKKNNLQVTIALYLFSILWILGLFSFYGIQEGRPEVLCKLFITCFLLNNVYQSKKSTNVINGLLVGLNLITSPVSTFYLMLITVGLLTYKNEFKLKPIVQTLLGFAIVLSCFAIVYPYHLIELIRGLQKHSQNVIVNRFSTDSFKTFISFYITYTYSPFLIFNFLIAIIYTGYKILKKSDWITFGLLVILTCLVSYFSFKDMPMNYNMIVLTPMFFFLIFVVITKVLDRSRSALQSKVLSILIALLLIVNSAGFIRKTLLFYGTYNDRVAYTDFRKEFVKVIQSTDKDKKVAITFSLWPYCLDQYKRITLNQTDTTIKYLFVQQAYSGATEPQPQPGFKLIKNQFITKRPRLGKLPLGNTYPWFQTALYQRN
ncbi:MAG: hypothetical protein ACRYFA_03080 [Janthinobacterium lividum]